LKIGDHRFDFSFYFHAALAFANELLSAAEVLAGYLFRLGNKLFNLQIDIIFEHLLSPWQMLQFHMRLL
jgi:hypothetical protein